MKGTGTSAALVGAILPVSNTPESVAVWAKVSEFNQFTDCPTFTDSGLGEYTPLVIVIVSRLGGFVPSGFPGEVVALAELPHPTAKRVKLMSATSVHRVARMGRLLFVRAVQRYPWSADVWR